MDLGPKFEKGLSLEQYLQYLRNVVGGAAEDLENGRVDKGTNRIAALYDWVVSWQADLRKVEVSKTLRDEFAMAALTGLAELTRSADDIADHACKIADSMMEARNVSQAVS